MRFLSLACAVGILAACADGSQEVASDAASGDDSVWLTGDRAGGDDATSGGGDTAGAHGDEDSGGDGLNAGDSPGSGDTEGDGDATNPWADRPVGQCTVDGDCPVGPMGQNCSRLIPGGVCLSCGTSDANCPGSTVCTTYGSCAEECSGDEDCPPGMSCGGTSLCRATYCVAGVCPVPWFGCNTSDRCERIACPLGSECPTATSCVNGLCIELHSL